MRGDEISIERSAPAARLVELARDELGHLSVRRRAEGFARLLARRSTAKPRKRLVVVLAALLTAVSVALLVRHGLEIQHAGALSYTVESGQLVHGGFVLGNGAGESKLQFSDGTEVVLFPGSRGQVRSVDEHGARIAVTGKARVEVVPWKGSHWLFDVGPFLITVKGTAFTAEWRDAEERLEVVLKTGTVAVSGPASDEAITLRAGQRLVISMRDKEVVIRDIDAAVETGDATSVPPRSPAKEGADPRHLENGTYAAAVRALTRAP